MQNVINNRKYSLVVLVQLMNYFAMWFGKISVEAYTDLSIYIVGGYVIANVAQKGVEKYVNKI